MQVVPPTRLKQELEKQTPMTVVDLQSPDKYHHAHVPGAVNIPVEQFEQDYATVLKDKTHTIVLYGEFDELGKGTQAAEVLEAAGFARVGRLEGGVMGWKEAGFATEGGLES